MTAVPQTTPRPGGTWSLAGHSVARIGYGAMQLGHRPHGAPVDRATAIAVLRRARTLGVDHIDTAAFYGDAAANDVIRAALQPYTDDLRLVTKVGARWDREQAALVLAQTPAELRAEVERNLTSLGAESLAVVNLRRTDQPPGLVADGEQIVDLDSQLAELVALRDAGKIEAIGLSHVSADQLRQALPVGIACVQNLYSLVDRRHEDLLELCREHGVAWAPYFPLGSAFPGLPKVTDLPAVQAVAARLGATPAQVGLAWLLDHAPNVLLIPGTATIAHLEENLAAGDLALDDAARAALDAAAA
jgi:aryl-alcohol dehydrogenase-like predicted oxidoreductase